MVKERRWSGKEFQILGAATRKLRWESSDLVVGTYKYIYMYTMSKNKATLFCLLTEQLSLRTCRTCRLRTYV